MQVRTLKTLIFVGLAFGLSWTVAGLFVLIGGQWATPDSIPMALLYMFMPALAAVLVKGPICREPLSELGVSLRLNRWYLVAWLLAPLAAFAATGVSLAFPEVSFVTDLSGIHERMERVLSPAALAEGRTSSTDLPLHPFWLGLIQGLLAGPTLNAVAGFGEELGWRGFLDRELSDLGFWRSSWLIGAIWGLWHAPLILFGHNYPEHPEAGVVMMVVFCLLWSPLFSYVRKKAASVVAAAVLHGSINATVGVALMPLRGGSDLIVGATGLAGLIVLAALNIGLYALLKRQQHGPPRPAPILQGRI